MDINTLVDSILLKRAAEDDVCSRRSAAKAADIIVQFLMTAVLVAVVFIVASI